MITLYKNNVNNNIRRSNLIILTEMVLLEEQLINRKERLRPTIRNLK